MPIASGTSLGPYTILAPIGSGGMGEVYRARDSRIGRDVAIKVLPDSLAKDPEGLSRFEHEARAAGMLNHPNLLTIYDFGTAAGNPYMVTELLEGQTLRDRMNAPPPLRQRQVVNLALQIASGLAAAHEKGIVHRDLKPENIFVTTEGRVKILDFGLAKHHPIFGQEKGPPAAHATEPGIVLGTVGYMSPEQVRGETLDQRSDIFSFGAILYELLAGRRAFRRETSIETLSAILREEPPDLTEVNGSIPPALDRMVRRCLEKNRQLRFQSARDLAFHLESLPPATMSGVVRPDVDAGAVRPLQEATADSAASTLTTPTPPGRVGAVAAGPPDPATSGTGEARSVSRTARSMAPGAHATTSRSSIRPRPFPQQAPPKRGIPPLHLLLLALTLLIAGALGGYLYHDYRDSGTVPTFNRLTFRRGEIFSARFAHDGDTLVYSAAWDGQRPELYLMRRESPESKPFGIADADVAAISDGGELAILMDRDRLTGMGTLARLPLMGGTPRKVMNDVLYAAYLPGSDDLGVIRREGADWLLEVPIGHVLLRSARMMRFLRVSPDGKRIAFSQPNGGRYEIVMIEEGQPEVLSAGWSHGVTGLAWTPESRELWFTAAESGTTPPSLYAVAPGKAPRLISRLTGGMSIEDLSPTGRVLLTHTNWRASLWVVRRGEEMNDTSRDISWLDWSTLRDLSADGSQVLFSETREGGGEAGSIYLRTVDGGAPVRLGEGFGDSIAPNGKSVLAHSPDRRLVRIPTGTGEPETVRTLDAFDYGVLWFPDGNRILIGGTRKGEGYRLFVQDLLTGDIRPVTPEGTWADAYRPWAISPDGRLVAAMNADRQLTLYAVDGERSTPVQAARPGEIPIHWSHDGISLYVYDPAEMPALVYRIDMVTGSRELWKELAPADPAGIYKIAPVLMTADGSVCAYNSLRSLAELYVAEGLR